MESHAGKEKYQSKERKETDAAGGGVTRKAASGAQMLLGRDWILWRDRGWRHPEGSLAPSAALEVHRRRGKQWYGKKLRRRRVTCLARRWRSRTTKAWRRWVSFRALHKPAGWHEPLRVKYMCDKKCNEQGFKFFEIASTLVEDDGRPHTINLCRK